jgi:hypothetical protein
LDFLIPFLQVALDNATTQAPIAAQQLAQTVASNTAGVDSNTTAIVATAITAAGGILGKHLYDSKKRTDTIATASDNERMLMQEVADNYNDFAHHAAIMEDFTRLVIQNPDSKVSEIFNMVVDDVTKETMGMRLVQFFQNIQKYNTEYYKNTAVKPNSLLFNSHNPLKNVRNLIKDMSTATPS